MDKTIVNESLMGSGNAWFPSQASTFAASIDGIFFFIYYGSIILTVGILVAVAYFIWKYRKKVHQQADHDPALAHNTWLELAWTIPPLILVMGIFVVSFKDYIALSIAPQNATQIKVLGKKWFWAFEYPNGVKTLGELVVPVNTPIQLLMSSDDVLHSFYIPNFRVKRDVIPNRYTKLWFHPTKTGQFQIFCTEYCGDGHSDMLASIRVLSMPDYQKWLLAQGSGGDDLPLEELGEKLYTSKACATCHSIDGSAKVGPTWKGLFGAKRQFVDGGSAVADENYIRESITVPAKHVVVGYGPVMPSYQGLLSDRELDALIEYIKTLK